MTGFFQKNTLSMGELLDMIGYIATESLLMFAEKGVFPDNDDRTAFWFRRMEEMNYTGDCSKWHASKICLVGEDVAKFIAADPIIFAKFVNAYSNDQLEKPVKQSLKEQLAEQMNALATELIWRRRLI